MFSQICWYILYTIQANYQHKEVKDLMNLLMMLFGFLVLESNEILEKKLRNVK